MDVAGGAGGCGTSGGCEDVWFFKSSSDDNGFGLVVFVGEPTEEVLTYYLYSRYNTRKNTRIFSVSRI